MDITVDLGTVFGRRSTSVQVHVPKADPAKVGPTPYRVKGNPEPRIGWGGIFISQDGAIEYDGRCWMELTKDRPARPATPGELLAGYIRWGGAGLFPKDMHRIESEARAAVCDVILHRGRLYVADVVPVYAVEKDGPDAEPSIEVVPLRWGNRNFDRGYVPIYGADEADAAVARYRSLGGRKRPPVIETLTTTRFDVDALDRSLRMLAWEIEDALAGPWRDRLLGPGSKDVFDAVMADRSLRAGRMLELIEPLAATLRSRLTFGADDRLAGFLDEIDDVARRHRARTDPARDTSIGPAP